MAQNRPNNSKMADYYGTLDSRLASRSSYFSLIHQFYDSTTTWQDSTLCYSPRQQMSSHDPDSPKFEAHFLMQFLNLFNMK